MCVPGVLLLCGRGAMFHLHELRGFRLGGFTFVRSSHRRRRRLRRFDDSFGSRHRGTVAQCALARKQARATVGRFAVAIDGAQHRCVGASSSFARSSRVLYASRWQADAARTRDGAMEPRRRELTLPPKASKRSSDSAEKAVNVSVTKYCIWLILWILVLFFFSALEENGGGPNHACFCCCVFVDYSRDTTQTERTKSCDGAEQTE